MSVTVEFPKQKPSEQEKPDVVFADLAKLSPIEYDKVREKKAKEMGVRVGTLDKAVSEINKGKTEAHGRAIKLYEPEPWHEPVTGSEALTAAANAIIRHMVIRNEDADACALWCAHTYIYKRFDHTPRLMITAPTAECGKTVLMSHMIGNMITKPQPVELMKPAPFFRLAEGHAPSFLIDEVDVFIQEDSELLAAINNGWEPHGGVLRCVGDDHEVRIFSTHCPVAMAGINLQKKLPATTRSRSITITLERAVVGEIADTDLYDSKKHRKALHVIGRKFARWCGDNEKQIQHADQKLPKSVRNRLANKWGPLFAIAQVAGGDWPKRAEKALFAQQDMSEPSKSELLLADTRRVVTGKVISTKELIHRLCGIEDAPWCNYNFREREGDRRHITDRQISNLLKPYKITPTQFKIAGDKTRGYRRSRLENAWERYLPEPTPKISGTPVQPSDSKGFSDIRNATQVMM